MPTPPNRSTTQMPKSFALTGATGFVGAAITDHLISKGHHVIVFARTPSKLHRPQDVEIVEGDLDNEACLARLSAKANILIHCAGLTHVRKDEEFFRVNVAGAEKLAKVFAYSARNSAERKRFVHISSLAARQPNVSPYAASKYQSEDVVSKAIEHEDMDWVTLRAPAMFGPRDVATLPFFKSVKRGFAPLPGGKNTQRASILYVNDFAQAVFTASTQAPPNALYEVGDQKTDGHTWSEITDACAESLGVKPHKLRIPRAVLIAWAAPSSFILRAMGRAPMVTPAKIAEFFYPDWAARDNLLQSHTSWTPETPLHEGFVKTSKWYQEQGLL